MVPPHKSTFDRELKLVFLRIFPLIDIIVALSMIYDRV